MSLRFVKGLICALLSLGICVVPVSAIEINGIQGATPLFADEDVTQSAESEESVSTHTPYNEIPDEGVEYTPVTLAESTKDFFATLDGDVTLTLISSQRDFVDGTYVEYYNDFYTDTKSDYYTFINTLKTISELNEYVKLDFIDPFSTTSYSFLEEYSDYDLKYGDLFVTCYSNFEGSPTTRRTVIELEKLFKAKETKSGKNKITGVNLEKILVGKLESLRIFRNINVAYIKDLCSEDNIKHLKSYLSGKRYNFDNISLKDEKLNGYDMIFIAAPMRDVTLEEIVLLNTFLENGGQYGKTVMYFCSANYIDLPNLHSFLKKWGVAVNGQNKLNCTEEDGYFAKNSQLVAISNGSEYTADADTNGGFYIMNECTPLSVVKSNISVKVKTLLKTKSDKVNELPKTEQIGFLFEDTTGTQNHQSYPLLTLSQKSSGDYNASSVVVGASVDFITNYMALQNPKSNKDYIGELNGNFELTAELLEKLNHHHRSEESGLGKYAVGLADMGYDTTSGLKTSYILKVAIISVAAFIVLLFGLLVMGSVMKKKNLQ